MPDTQHIHHRELNRLGAFLATFAALSATSYLVDWEAINAEAKTAAAEQTDAAKKVWTKAVEQAEAKGETPPDEPEPVKPSLLATIDLRPWTPDEPLPLVGMFDQSKSVVESEPGRLTVADNPTEEPAGGETAVEVPVEIPVEIPVPPTPAAADGGMAAQENPTEGADAGAKPVAQRPPPPKITLPVRKPAVPTPLEIPAGALDAWFTALAQAEQGAKGHIARAFHWGDSIIAADGIPGAVRDRLQEKFGDGGPGFLSVQVDPRWQMRPGIVRKATGEWDTANITQGGANKGRYGLAGTVSTSAGAAKSVLTGRKVDGARQPLHVFDVYFQSRPGGGTLKVKPKGAAGFATRTGGGRTADRFKRIVVPEGSTSVTVTAPGNGKTTVYGVALETEGPGVTWENFGVAGASQASLLRQPEKHLATQIKHRSPHLIVYQMGGNALSYPALRQKDGGAYTQNLRKILGRLRAGAPKASCLIISPFDKGEHKRGRIVSKANLDRMITLQRGVATELGCAFWDGRHAMGGENSIGRWYKMKPRLAVADLSHLTRKGQKLMGNTLADAMLAAYTAWRYAHPKVEMPAVAAPTAPTDAPAPEAPANEEKKPAVDGPVKSFDVDPGEGSAP
ncbi:MAG: GDSL-type esterase/lipase family protein [Bradymonadia bacterium]